MASHSTGDGGIPPRDAGKRGLKRVMTFGGHYGTRNYTVKDLRDQKGKRVLVETLSFSPEEAAAAEEAGIENNESPLRSEGAAALCGDPPSRAQHLHGVLRSSHCSGEPCRGGAARL